MTTAPTDPPPVFPIPIKTATDCGPGVRVKHPAYEKAYTLTSSGRLMIPLVGRIFAYLDGKRAINHLSKIAGGVVLADPTDNLVTAHMTTLRDELDSIVSINPPDELLADYRALRLRLFMEGFLRTAINSVVDPSGAISAARLMTSDGKFQGAKFSELAKVGIAALLDGRDEMIRDALHVYLDAMTG